MTVLDTARAIFRQAGRIPMDSENIGSDVNVIGSISGTWSLPNVVSRIEDAEEDIASVCKAVHVSGLISSYSDGTYSGGNLYNQPTDDILRVLPDRVFYNGNRCRRVTADRQRFLENSGRAPTSTYPVVVIEDAHLEVFPQGGNTAKFYYVKSPGSLSAPSNSAYDTFVSSGTDNSDSLTIPDRFKMAVVAHVCSSLGETLQSSGVSDLYQNIYNTEISAYRRGVSGSSFKDEEVDIE